MYRPNLTVIPKPCKPVPWWRTTLAFTTVTDRETEGTSRATSSSGVTETGVWDESGWGRFVWGGRVNEMGVYDESR